MAAEWRVLSAVRALCAAAALGAGAIAGGPVGAIDDLAVRAGPAPGTLLLTFTAPPGAQRYVVRRSVRQLDAQGYRAVAPEPLAGAPAPAGTRETIPLEGLEPGQVYYVSVHAVVAGAETPFSFAVSARVPGGPPIPPAGARRLTAPGPLDEAGATYRLARDVEAAGTAFTITAPDVTLDLGGHTVRYGAAGRDDEPGIVARGLSGRLVVRNGAIRQAGGGARSEAVRVRECRDVALRYLTVEVGGADCDGLSVARCRGDVRVDHCTVACKTARVANRHYPGVAAIRLVEGTGGTHVHHNTVTASPQWGIYLHGGRQRGALVHHNRVVGTKALVVNGYMLAIHVPEADVFENFLSGESRGIHIENEAARGARVHDNFVRVQDQTNPEYPRRHWVHGIKVERAPGCRVYRNRVIGIADREHAEVFAVDLDSRGAPGIEVFANRVDAIARDATFPAHALHWAAGEAEGSGRVFWNVFRATDTGFRHGWLSGATGLVRDNLWLDGGAGRCLFERFDVSDKLPARGNRIVDPMGDVDFLAVRDWPRAGPWETTREWTVRVLVREGGAAVAGAEVVLTNRRGEVALRERTDAAGRAGGTVVAARIGNGARVVDLNPFTLFLAGRESRLEIAGRTAVIVQDGRATRDTEPPGAPAALAVKTMGASRLLASWQAPRDETGVVAYLVSADGEPAGVTAATRFILAGLEPGRRHEVAVRAVDAGGNLSPAAVGAAATGPEDRGAERR